jgi:hypothetical protein
MDRVVMEKRCGASLMAFEVNNVGGEMSYSVERENSVSRKSTTEGACEALGALQLRWRGEHFAIFVLARCLK